MKKKGARMKTFQEQKEFFDKNWNGLKAAVEKGGGEEAVKFIEGFEGVEKRVMYFFARMGLVMGDWQNKNFDDYIAVVDSGISMLLNEEQNAPEEEKAKLYRSAHIMNYNLSADLADCWPGDDLPRTKEHYTRGLKAAEDCIKLQGKLGNEPGSLSMDYWAKGMHELSLGEIDKAVGSWDKSYEYAKTDAEKNEKTSRVAKDAPFGVILGHGYLGLARWINGEEKGKAQYDEAIKTFKAQTEDEATKGDAEFGISQLEKVKQNYLKE
jgi:hypothetical protein